MTGFGSIILWWMATQNTVYKSAGKFFSESGTKSLLGQLGFVEHRKMKTAWKRWNYSFSACRPSPPTLSQDDIEAIHLRKSRFHVFTEPSKCVQMGSDSWDLGEMLTLGVFLHLHHLPMGFLNPGQRFLFRYLFLNHVSWCNHKCTP